jgi:hypothetical protein
MKINYANNLIVDIRFFLNCNETSLTPKVMRGQILAFVGFGHVALIRRCDMIFWEFYSR